ncbi:hypothetical protein KEM52_005276 [Ascosphaera acerosa]|nr:hypothetical protein KEM52_005276 [Ascosphaera acerosa]
MAPFVNMWSLDVEDAVVLGLGLLRLKTDEMVFRVSDDSECEEESKAAASTSEAK